MSERPPGLSEFAREAEHQYLRLADLAESAGVTQAAQALREKASRMRAWLGAGERGRSNKPPANTDEAHRILWQLYELLGEQLEQWPPGTSQELDDLLGEVHEASRRLSHLGKPAGSARPRRKASARETPASVDPPSFPGPRSRR